MEMSRSWSSAHDWKSCKGQKLFESSNLSISATSEQSPLCSDVFFCLWQKNTSSARSLAPPSPHKVCDFAGTPASAAPSVETFAHGKSSALRFAPALFRGVISCSEKYNISFLSSFDMSEHSPLCSDLFFCLWQKNTSSARSLALPLPSKSATLRGPRHVFLTLRHKGAFSCAENIPPCAIKTSPSASWGLYPLSK